MCRCTPTIRTPFCGKGDCHYPQKMEADKPYKLEDEPDLLSALQSDLADILADSVKANKLIRGINDRAFDLMRKIIAIKKSNANTKEEAGDAGQRD